MNIGYLNEYTIPIVLLMCLCIGYLIKNCLSFIPNKYIPLILAVVGIIINLANCSVEIYNSIGNPSIGPLLIKVAAGGIISGLMSTGTYEAFRNIINGKGNQ